MTLRFQTEKGPVEIEPDACVVAGWTGRDTASVQAHIDELVELGVAPPSRTPLAYRVSPALLTQEDSIQCLGSETSGEAEPAVIFANGERWLTLASDHTDRALESSSVAISKQACAKPLASQAWALATLVDTDALMLRSWIRENGEWTLYQEGALVNILPLDSIIESSGIDTATQTVLLCGTLPVHGAVRPASAMRLELHDTHENRSIMLAYSITELPMVA